MKTQQRNLIIIVLLVVALLFFLSKSGNFLFNIIPEKSNSLYFYAYKEPLAYACTIPEDWVTSGGYIFGESANIKSPGGSIYKFQIDPAYVRNLKNAEGGECGVVGYSFQVSNSREKYSR